jgi:hypothetical protein
LPVALGWAEALLSDPHEAVPEFFASLRDSVAAKELR